MDRYLKTIFVVLGFIGGSACKELQQGSKKAPIIFQAPPAAANAGEQNPAPAAPTTNSKVAEPPLAKLAGYPESKSPNSQFDISVTGVAEYKWKVAEAATDCQLSAAYSAYVPANTPIKLDLASRKESPAIIALCVIGKSSAGEEQSFATMATWVWAPEFPSITDQIDLVEGNNEIKITPKAPSGNWLVIRSREPLNAMPEDGKDYTVNQPLGNGTVMVAGPMAEFIDKSVKNEETWNYTFVAYNSSKRFSIGMNKSMTLSKQELIWVPNNLIVAGQVPLEARANNKRYVCRARHTDAATAQNRGMQPGSMFTANNDLKSGNCFYEYGGVVYRTINYDLLMANKGSPTELIRWARGQANATGTTIPNGSIIAGTDDTGATIGPALYICLTVNAQISGKAGAHLPNGCRSYVGNNNGTPSVSTNFEVLAFK